jgi:enoyl-CoA hydratase/carnithine racemase
VSDKVLYQKKGEVAYITLNRLEVKNAIDLEVHHRLREIWTDFRDDRVLRAAILTGTGDAFCAGADPQHARARVGQRWSEPRT